jgi:hypothetical protein
METGPEADADAKEHTVVGVSRLGVDALGSARDRRAATKDGLLLRDRQGCRQDHHGGAPENEASGAHDLENRSPFGLTPAYDLPRLRVRTLQSIPVLRRRME